MTKINYLEKILPLLTAHNVTVFKSQGIEIHLDGHSKQLVIPKSSQEATHSIQTIKVEGMIDPHGLDEEMDPDRILNWSAPFSSEKEVPLTNDIPLA